MELKNVLSIKHLSWGEPHHGSIGIITHSHYCDDPTLGVGKCAIITITCTWITCMNQLNHTWYTTIDSSSNQNICSRVYYFKHFLYTL